MKKIQKNYVYIKFPFGILCYEGLKELKSYYERILFQEKINEDRNWLINVKSFCSQLKIDVNKIKEHLKDHVWNSKSLVLNPKDTAIQSFVGKCWLTNYDIDVFFEIINKNYDNFISFV